MEVQIQAIKDQIPIVHDGLSMIMFMGITLGIYLSVVIFMNWRKQRGPLIFFGWLILSASLISLDIYLCYTGLMKEVLFLNDSTEFLVLLLGPFIYLFLYATMMNEPYAWRKQGGHFVVPALYLLTQTGFMIEQEAVKLNAYISGFHPDLDHVVVSPNVFWPMYHFGKTNHHELILITCAIYIILSVRLIWGRKNTTSIQQPWINKLAFSKTTIVVFAVISLLLLVVFVAFDNDQGDPYIVVIFTLFIILSNYRFSSSSRIFQKTWLQDKYQSSGMAENASSTLAIVHAHIERSGFALQQNVTLQSLSDQLDIPSTYISQAINSELGINFNDYINQFRIEKVKKYLVDPAYSHLNIEGIGQSVGFKSKSSFYAAFKKITGSTPSVFMKTTKNT